MELKKIKVKIPDGILLFSICSELSCFSALRRCSSSDNEAKNTWNCFDRRSINCCILFCSSSRVFNCASRLWIFLFIYLFIREDWLIRYKGYWKKEKKKKKKIEAKNIYSVETVVEGYCLIIVAIWSYNCLFFLFSFSFSINLFNSWISSLTFSNDKTISFWF